MIWKFAVPEAEAAGYSSIVITGSGTSKQYIQFLGKSLVGVDAKSGKLLWRDLKKGDKDMPNIPTPTIDGPYVYSVPMRLGGRLIKLNTLNLAADPQEVYFSPKLPKAIGGTVKIGNYLYGTGEALMCVDFATGGIQWTEAASAPHRCAMPTAVYICTARTATWRSWKLRPMRTVKEAASRRRGRRTADGKSVDVRRGRRWPALHSRSGRTVVLRCRRRQKRGVIRRQVKCGVEQNAPSPSAGEGWGEGESSVTPTAADPRQRRRLAERLIDACK